MKKSLYAFVFTLVVFVILLNDISAQEQALYVTDVVLVEESCPGDYVRQIEPFSDGAGVNTYLCIKKAAFIPGESNVVDASFKLGDCVNGEERGFFRDIQNSKASLCVVKYAIPEVSALREFAVLSGQGTVECADGFEKSGDIISVAGGKTAVLCLKRYSTDSTSQQQGEQAQGDRQEEWSCEDSDVGGVNQIYVRGRVEIKHNGVVTSSYADKCYSQTEVIEAICPVSLPNDNAEYQILPCPRGTGTTCNEVDGIGACSGQGQAGSQGSGANQNSEIQNIQCFPRETINIPLSKIRTPNDLCRQVHGGGAWCNINEKPECTGLGWLNPFNWVPCMILQCNTRAWATDVRVTCCQPAA